MLQGLQGARRAVAARRREPVRKLDETEFVRGSVHREDVFQNPAVVHVQAVAVENEDVKREATLDELQVRQLEADAMVPLAAKRRPAVVEGAERADLDA